MTHKLDADDFFIHRVQRHCAEAGLNFFLVEPLWVEVFSDYVQRGLIWPRVLLNMHSEHHQPEEVYHRLINLAAQKHTRVIDPPDRARAAFDKARLHPRLVAAGLRVPHTVVVPAAARETFRLAETDRVPLGSPFVIKPAMGYGRRGVVLDATGEADLARSAAAWPGDSYLLQERVTSRRIDGAPAYWRVYYVFGSVWCSWWNCFTDEYRLVTATERETLNLAALEDTIRRIAALTEMQFFSSEITQNDAGEFVVIDYVNDQCHLLSQSANPRLGVPDELIAAIARRLVEAVREMVMPARAGA